MHASRRCCSGLYASGCPPGYCSMRMVLQVPQNASIADQPVYDQEALGGKGGITTVRKHACLGLLEC